MYGIVEWVEIYDELDARVPRVGEMQTTARLVLQLNANVLQFGVELAAVEMRWVVQ